VFDVAPTEFLLVAVVALVVIGPKDLPRLMRTVGQWVARARGVARHFRIGLDTMMREAELEEMEQKWKAENERIMREYPSLPPSPGMSGPDVSGPDVSGPGTSGPATSGPVISGPDSAGREAPSGGKSAPGDDTPPVDPRPLP
jgi:sec-independent protein translocase protein TatB